MRHRLLELLATIRACSTTPRLFNRSVGHSIPKKGLPHVDDAHLQLDTRTIHSYGFLSTFFYKAMWRNCAPRDLKETPHFAYGAVPHMRREQAISVRMIVQHRLRTAGRSSAMKFYNVKNAYPK